MKSTFLLFLLIILLSACLNLTPTQLEAENTQLRVTIDSLQMKLELVQVEAVMQRKITEKQTEEALRQKDIAEQQTAIAQQAMEIAKKQEKLATEQATRARIAVDSANALKKRMKDPEN